MCIGDRHFIPRLYEYTSKYTNTHQFVFPLILIAYYPEGGETDRERGRKNSVPYRVVLGGNRCSSDDIKVCVAV